jgi:hypothetical protein
MEPWGVAILVSFLMWWLGLGLAICGTARSVSEKVGVIAVIPILSGAGILFGICCDVIVFVICGLVRLSF